MNLIAVLAWLFYPEPPAPGSLWVCRGDRFEPATYEIVKSNQHGVRYRMLSRTFLCHPSSFESVRSFRFNFRPKQ